MIQIVPEIEDIQEGFIWKYETINITSMDPLSPQL